MRVTEDRVIELYRLQVTGQPKPKDLSLEEEQAWKSLEADLALAKKKGWQTYVPNQ